MLLYAETLGYNMEYCLVLLPKNVNWCQQTQNSLQVM